MTMPGIPQVPEFPWDDEEKLDELLSGLGSIEELGALISAWFSNGDITQEQGDAFAKKYSVIIDPYTTFGIPDNVKEYLESANSKAQLADYLLSLGLDRNTFDQWYKGITSSITPTDWTMIEAQGRSLAAQKAVTKARSQYQQEIAPALDIIHNSPYTTEKDLALLSRTSFGGATKQGSPEEGVAEASAALPPQVEPAGKLGTEESIAAINSILQGISNREQRAKQKGAIAGQSNKAFIAGLNKPVAQAKKTPLGSVVPLAEGFVGGTGLAEGTKLRSFIEGETYKIAQDTQQERLDWWKRMNPDTAPTFGSERDRITAEMNKWQQIAGSASSAYGGAGGIYYEGGLAGVAQNAYEYSKRNLAKLKEEDFGEPEPVRTEEDPFLIALRKRLSPEKARAQYNRRPGAGIVPRLTPSVKF
uniref:Uncharacterized protein n=1 Tax=viral metagenome TaxID=1070528 RepID=A0A6M3L341_9ZZZZ